MVLHKQGVVRCSKGFASRRCVVQTLALAKWGGVKCGKVLNSSAETGPCVVWLRHGVVVLPSAWLSRGTISFGDALRRLDSVGPRFA